MQAEPDLEPAVEAPAIEAPAAGFVSPPKYGSHQLSNQPPSEPDIEHREREVVAEPIEVLAIAIEQRIIEILGSAPAFGETIEAAYRRKERELGTLFGSVTRSEAAILQRRLNDPRHDDTLATRFARLVVDRRTRLLAVLADIPRREARRR